MSGGNGCGVTMVRINDDLDIPESELSFRYSRSSGPGGQNVNKVATKVTLLYPLTSSSVLSEEQKLLVERRLANRISKEGVLHVTSERHRTRSANQRDAVEKFTTLLAEALSPPKRRRRTRVPSSERRRRVESKRRHAHKKKLRSRPTEDD